MTIGNPSICHKRDKKDVQSSVRKETFPSILIRQFYPLVLLSILLIAVVMMISHEAMKAIETLAEEEEQGKK
ncbi:MAG: hypothetical protein ACUVUS_08565 [Thermoproteota archaeon]